MQKLTTKKPHLIKAIYNWMIENNLSPCIGIVSNYPRNIFPKFVEKEGIVVLEISPLALNNLNIGQEITTIEASVKGALAYFEFYTEAISFITTKENIGEHFEFEVIDYEEYIENYKVTKKQPYKLELIKND